MRDIHRGRRGISPETDRPGIGREHAADQGEVWARIADYQLRCELRDRSTDLLDALRQSTERDTEPVELGKARDAGQAACGALIFVGGEFVGGDLLGTSGWFAAVRDELLGSATASHRYARAIARGRRTAPDRDTIAIAAETIVDGLRRGAWKRHRPLGVEQAWQLEHPFLEASATLGPAGEPLHLLVGTRHRPGVFACSTTHDWRT